MSELSDYKRLVEKPHIEQLRRTIDALRDEIATAYSVQKLERACIKSLQAERDALQHDIERLRGRLEQIRTVCIDNAADTVRHDLALKFVGHVAETALATLRVTDHDGRSAPK